MVYIGIAFTYFPYHVEAEDVASVSYIFESANVWCVTACSHCSELEYNVADFVYAPKFVSDFEGGGR